MVSRQEFADFFVSIRTRPEGRVKHAITVRQVRRILVSIRTRPEGRVKLAQIAALRSWQSGFQSAPGPKAG